MLVLFEHVVGRQAYQVFNAVFFFADGLGQIGVSAFFVISGLVLPLSLGKDYNWKRLPNFLIRRIVRIEPTFLCSALAASLLIFLMTAVAPEGKLWWPSFKQFALHAFYLIPFSKEEWILPVYWTLAVEFQFYLVIGLLFPLVTKIGRRFPDFTVLLCACFGLAAYAAPNLQQVQLLKYSPCFALGMVLAARIIFGSSAFFSFISILIISVVSWNTGLNTQTLIGSGAAGVVAAFWTKPIKKTGFWVKPWWWVGTISYSLYVTHQALASAGENVARFALRLDSGLLGQVIANLAPFGTITASFVAAWLLYRWVEKPTLELSKKLTR